MENSSLILVSIRDFFLDWFSCFKYCRKKLGGTWYQVYEEYDDMVGSRSAFVYWTREQPIEIGLPWFEKQVQKTETYQTNIVQS